MFKTATFICIGLCLLASQAFAGANTQAGNRVTLASSSGLWARVASPSTEMARRDGNVCGAAVNTGGITRATTAVKVGGRVFLTGGSGMNSGTMRLTATRHATYREPAVRKSPMGLGALLASIFGLAS